LVILSNKYILDTAGFRGFQDLHEAFEDVLTGISGYRTSDEYLKHQVNVMTDAARPSQPSH